MTSTTTTFLVPEFTKDIPNKIFPELEVTAKHTLSTNNDANNWRSAVATSGFPSNQDGVYVFVTKIDDMANGHLNIGFTDIANAYLSAGLRGTALHTGSGCRYPGTKRYLSPRITLKPKNEIISILTISNGGTKKHVQWIIDGHKGPLHECVSCMNADYHEYGFGDGKIIFPCISLGISNQRVTMIPFDQVQSRCPKIDQLMEEFIKNNKQNQENDENHHQKHAPTQEQIDDARIAELRDQAFRNQHNVNVDQCSQIHQLRLQLTFKDQEMQLLDRTLRNEMKLVQSQLELERAEHQKTQNLLQQQLQTKESGKIRQREEE